MILRVRTQGGASSAAAAPRRGVILLAVLVVVAILTLIGYRFFTLMNAEHEAAYASNRVMQGRYLADSGLQYAAFVLSYPQNVGLSDAPDESSNLVFPGLVYDNPSVFHMRPVTSNSRNPGFFSIVSPRSADDPLLTSARRFRFGPEDEGGKININALIKLDRTGQKAKNILMKLPNMTSDIADSIIYWANNNSSSATGAAGDSMYYSSLGYGVKNGPYETLEELLFVKNITPHLLFGNDMNRNGSLETEEDDGTGVVDRGWSRLLTIYSRERNVDSSGNQRVWINDTDLNNLETNLQNAGVDQDVINFILAYRLYGTSTQTITVQFTTGGTVTSQGRVTMQTNSRATVTAQPAQGVTMLSVNGMAVEDANNPAKVTALKREDLDTSNVQANQLNNISSIYDLIDATVTRTMPSQGQGQQGQGQQGQGQQGQGQNQQQTVKYQSPLQKSDLSTLRELLPTLLDKVTTSQQLEMTPKINVNTAPIEVLQAIAGVNTNSDTSGSGSTSGSGASGSGSTSGGGTRGGGSNGGAGNPLLSDTDLQNILDHRPTSDTDPSQGALYRTPAWLITEAGLDPTVVKNLDSYITTRSQVYRVQVVGYYEQGGPTVRLEAVIDTNSGRPKLLYWRDLTELGRGFDVRNAAP